MIEIAFRAHTAEFQRETPATKYNAAKIAAERGINITARRRMWASQKPATGKQTRKSNSSARAFGSMFHLPRLKSGGMAEVIPRSRVSNVRVAKRAPAKQRGSAARASRMRARPSL